MNDVEHMDTSYLWRASKPGRRVHILDFETGRTFCQVENCGGKPLDGRGAEVPAGRRICGNCADLAGRDEADYQEPSLAVLLGERIADEGSGKWGVDAPFGCADTIAPKPPKWKKQTRPAHRSKGRKSKRSNVKYHMPFNDDLPSW